MTGFAMVLGGAVKGYGAGVLEQARAKREAALQAIAEERADRRLAEDRKFRSDEAAIGRKAQSEENEKDRAARREEREDVGGTYQETDEGIVRLRGDTATPVTGKDGKPVTKKKDMPTAQEFEEMVERRVKTEFQNTLADPDPKTVEAARKRARTSLRVELGFDKPKVPAPPAPRDPAKRKVGEVYSSPSGAEGKWTGDGWEPVE